MKNQEMHHVGLIRFWFLINKHNPKPGAEERHVGLVGCCAGQVMFEFCYFFGRQPQILSKFIRQPNQVKYVALGTFLINNNASWVFCAGMLARVLALDCFMVRDHLGKLVLDVEQKASLAAVVGLRMAASNLRMVRIAAKYSIAKSVRLLGTISSKGVYFIGDPFGLPYLCLIKHLCPVIYLKCKKRTALTKNGSGIKLE